MKEIQDDAENITREMARYIQLKCDAIKLQLVENLSLFFSDALSLLVGFLLVVLMLFFLSLALMFFLAPYLGYVGSALCMAALPALIAIPVYLNRRKLFANRMIQRFCKMFFQNEGNE